MPGPPPSSEGTAVPKGKGKKKRRSSKEAGDSSDSGSSTGSGVKGKLKSFWNKTVVPAFPEAIADISLIKAALSVEAKITKELKDVTRHPEVAKIGTVRRGYELSPEETAFREMRKVKVRDAFCRYLDLDPAEVHVDDVPIVAFGGSGGGYRAMIGVLGYCDEMKRSGLWDLLTYVTGVSGSCWSLAAYYTWGGASMQKVITHCRKRLHPYHPLSPEAIREVLNAPGGPTKTLGPLVQKHRSGLSTVAMDLYSVFTTGHLFLMHDPSLDPPGVRGMFGVKKEVAGYHETWLKWSSANVHFQDGAEPMPILTAIRHERPWKDWVDKEHPFKDADPGTKEHEEAQDAWFNWFEISPIEVGCDELEAWCPTWAFGRPFEKGQDVMQIPEQSLAILLGLCTSAPAGPLTSYLATIKRSLPPGFIGSSVHDMAKGIARMWGPKGEKEFQGHHPLHAVNEHNFMFHLSRGLEATQGDSQRVPPIENSPRIHLIDSGMDNNCPTYVMLHPRREVDVILNMDASSDVLKDSFQDRVDQIGSRRGLRFTKRHPELKAPSDDPKDPKKAKEEKEAEGPKDEESKKSKDEKDSKDPKRAKDEKDSKDSKKPKEEKEQPPKDPDRFKDLYAQIYDGAILSPSERPRTVTDSYGKTVTNPPAPACDHPSTMVYMPLLPNDRAVPDFDPSTSKFSGSYNLVWTPQQVDMLLKVCGANFLEGENTIKQVLREAWERKKRLRTGEVAHPTAAPEAAEAVAEAPEQEQQNNGYVHPPVFREKVQQKTQQEEHENKT